MEEPLKAVLVTRATRITATWLYAPEESAACYCGLYEEHVSVCDMAQNPVNQLAVVRDCVHAESSKVW